MFKLRVVRDNLNENDLAITTISRLHVGAYNIKHA